MDPQVTPYVDWFLRDADWFPLLMIPVFTGVGRLPDQLDRPDHAVQPDPVPRRADQGDARAGQRAAAQDPGGARTAPGRDRLAGHHPRARGKMGSIAVDKAIAKLGTPGEFYTQLEPDKIAAHIVEVFEPEVPELVDTVMRQERPRLWRDVPTPVKESVYARVQVQLPSIIEQVTTEIGVHIDQLLDPKIMVIDHFERNPRLVVRIFRDFGQRGARPDGRVRVRLRLPARDPGGAGRPLVRPVVAAAGARRGGRLDHQRARDVADLRAAGAAADPRRTGAGSVPAAPGRGGRGLRPDHRRGRDHPSSTSGTSCSTPERRPHPQMLADELRPAIDRAAGVLRGAVRVVVGTRDYDTIPRVDDP